MAIMVIMAGDGLIMAAGMDGIILTPQATTNRIRCLTIIQVQPITGEVGTEEVLEIIRLRQPLVVVQEFSPDNAEAHLQIILLRVPTDAHQLQLQAHRVRVILPAGRQQEHRQVVQIEALATLTPDVVIVISMP